MLHVSHGFLIAALAALLAAAATAGPAALPKNDPGALRPADPVASSGQAPDCASAATLTVGPGTDETIAGATIGLDNLVDAYACEPWNETGPEQTYRLVVETATMLRATIEITDQDPTQDLDLFLLGSCDSDDCLAAATNTFMIGLSPGEYFLVVDGYRGDEGAYELRVEGFYAGLDQAACDGATVVPVDVGEAEIEGELCDAVNYVITAPDCGEYLAFGGEAWYRLDLARAQEVTIVVTEDSIEPAIDFALWLFDACGDEPVCLDYADTYTAGQAETLTFHNTTGAPLSVLLGVDSTVPYASLDGICYSGNFILTLTGVTAAERSSLGGLKRRFR